MEKSWVGCHRRALLTTSILLAVVWPLSASAYRPFDSTDAAVASKATIEVELGPVGYLAQGPDRWVVAPNIVLNWGFADRWELVVQGRGLLHVAGDVNMPGLLVDDTGVFLKTVWREGSLQEKDGPSLATEVGPLLPNVNGATGLGAWFGAIASQRWEYVTVHLNPAFVWTPAHTLGFFGGVIVEGKDAWTVRPVAELVIETEAHAPTTFSSLIGGIWRVSESLSLDAAFRRARIGDMDATEVRAGLTWAFGVGPR